jgi:hypothetical protein
MRPKYCPADKTYTSLEQLQKENSPLVSTFLDFTPEKLCEMPYLSDYKCAGEPWRSVDCSAFSPEQLSRYNCTMKGMIGRPLNPPFVYHSASNDNWQNGMIPASGTISMTSHFI